MEPVYVVSWTGYARADFRHPRAVAVVIIEAENGGWRLWTLWMLTERLDREPRSVRGETWFRTRREAAARAREIVEEVGRLADDAAAGRLIAA